MTQKLGERIQEQLNISIIVVFIALIINIFYNVLHFINLIHSNAIQYFYIFLIKCALVPLAAILVISCIFVSNHCFKNECYKIFLLGILSYLFNLIKFSGFELNATTFLYIVHSLVYLTFFGITSVFLSFLIKNVNEWNHNIKLIILSCVICCGIHLIVPVFFKKNADAMIFLFLLAFVPCLLLVLSLYKFQMPINFIGAVQYKRKYDYKKTLQIMLLFLLFSSIIVSSLYYFNREATDMEGIDVYCSLLLNKGKMIYRDYFFYVPPIYIFRQNIVWSLFDGSILPIRLLGLVDRALIVCLTFWLLCRWFKPLNAYLACLLTYFTYNTNRFNSYGDYTSLCQLFLIISCYFAIKFTEELKKQKVRGASCWLLIAGITATQSIMTKQSIGLVALVFLFTVLICYCFIQREGIRTWRWIGIVIISFLIGIAPYIVWLGANGALDEFFNQVFLGSLNSKGVVISGTSQETSSLVRILKNIFDKDSIIIWTLSLSGLICNVFSTKKNSKENRLKKFWSVGQRVFSFLVVVYISKQLYDQELLVYLKETAKFSLKNMDEMLPFFGSVIFIIGTVIYYLRKKTAKNKIPAVALLVTMLTFISWFCSTLLTQEQNKELVNCFPITKLLPLLYEYAFHYTVFFVVYEILNLLVFRKTVFSKESWFFIALSLANSAVSLIGGGTAEFASNGALWTLPFTSCLFLYYFERNVKNNEQSNIPKESFIDSIEKKVGKIIPKSVVIGIICFTTLISMSQHINSVYSFHGWSALPIDDIRSYKIDIERYNGMLVSKRTKLTLEEVTKLVKENSDENDFVWSFPVTKIYNILAERMVQPTIAPTYFFDTCPDYIALYDLEIIKENLPKIIIWKEMGESSWVFYEKNYRNGAELGQRKIQKWFNSIKDSEYTLIGNVYNEYVYLRNDSIPKYTYYSDGNDLVGKIAEVKDNVQRLNLNNFTTDTISGYKEIISISIVVMIGLILLCVGVSFWKILVLILMLLCYHYSFSFIYVFCLIFIFTYLLLIEKKMTLTWLECIVILAIILLATFQWTDYAALIRTLLVQPLIKILIMILVIDTYREINSLKIKSKHQ